MTSPAAVPGSSADPPAERASATLRRLVAPVYLPIIAGTFGLGLLIPVLPLYLTEVGLSLGRSATVLAAIGVGSGLGAVPAGALIARFGERLALLVGLVLIAASTALLGVTEVAIALAALRVVTGGANAMMRLSRQSFITRTIDARVRGRAMSLIGGSFRASLFVGPLTGGLLVDLIGFEATFAVAGALTALGLIPAWRAVDPPSDPSRSSEPSGRRGIVRALLVHRRRLLRIGLFPLLVMTAREGRYVVLPLIGDDLGLSATAIGVLVSVGTAADLTLFPLSGWMMDHVGRLAAMVPAYGLMAAGLVVLGFAGSTVTAVLAGALIGVGNGMSAGTLLTLGSDLAPPDDVGPFLAGLAVMQDGGRVVGPLVVGAVGSWLGLGAAAVALAVLLAAGIGWLILVIGETGRHPGVAGAT